MDKKWHKQITYYNIAKQIGMIPGTIDTYYKELMIIRAEMLAQQQQEEIQKLSTTFATTEITSEYLWHKTGQCTWFIDKEILDVLDTAKIDDDITGISIPQDVISFTFERGIIIDGFPLRTAMFFTPRSTITRQLLQNNLHIKLEDKTVKLLCFYIDVGENGQTHQFSEDTDYTKLIKWHCHRGYDKLPNVTLSDDPKQSEALYHIMRICIAAIMMHAARPERLVPFKLPRSQRYEYKGERSNFKRLTLPAIKTIYEHRVTGESTGRTVKPHYRGWVYRVLRNEKYKRNPDGTFRVIEIEPTVVHPELIE